jgi:uncharacterized protein YkwD
MKPSLLLCSLFCFLFFTGLNGFVPAPPASLADEVLAATNQFRKANQLPALEMNEDLNALAQKHSEDMAKGRVAFGHAGFQKRNEAASKSISSARFFAENVAYGASTATEVLTLWKNSPGHRRNMLGKYIYIGIGIAKDKNGQLYYTQVFAG